jgi:hypothetical protein
MKLTVRVIFDVKYVATGSEMDKNYLKMLNTVAKIA